METMNKNIPTLTLCVALMLAPVAVQAQETPEAPPVPAIAPVAPAPPDIRTVYVGDSGVIASSQAEALKAKIALDANAMSVRDAFKSVAEQVKIPIEFAEDVPADAKVTLTLKGVSAADALRLLSREAGVFWRYEKTETDGKKTEIIKVSKKIISSIRGTSISVSGDPSAQTIVRFPSAATFAGATKAAHEAMADRQVQNTIRQALAASGQAMREYTSAARQYTNQYSGGRGAALPDKRVKLDSRNAKIRDLLKDVLKQADLPYALDNDVPEDVKRSFTFENVPVSMALDLITRSVEIGWRAERQKDGKMLILIGKKYVRAASLFNTFGSAEALSPDFAPLAFGDDAAVFGKEAAAFGMNAAASALDDIVIDSDDEDDSEEDK